jgi:RimJ/RimL family protein N-acetyltransferase
MTIKLYKTERFYVRPFTKEDMTEQYRSWFHDADVTRHNSHGLFPYTKEQMARFLAQLESSDDLVWAVIVKPEEGKKFVKHTKDGLNYLEGIHIGNVSLQNIHRIYRSAEFACVFGEKDYWGKGYGTEAAKMIFNHGFNRLNLHRIFTGTSSTNIGMQKIAKKLGMIHEGTFKEAMFLNGEYVDIYEYGILAREFNKTT